MKGNSKRKVFRINFKDMGILYALLLAWLFLALTNKNFQGSYAYLNILRDSSMVGICAVGMTFAITAGMMDLSVGTMMALLAVVNLQMISVIGLWCFPVLLVLGALCGLINGLLVAKVKLPAFIATLSMQYIFSATARLISHEQQVRFTERWFNNISNGNVPGTGIPIPFVAMLLLALLGAWLMSRSTFGRKVTALGNSEHAANAAGISVEHTQISIFVVLGIFTAIAAFFISSYLNMADADIVPGYEFDVITAVVLGGTALSGGKGSVFNSIVAAIFVSTLNMGMDAFQINSFVQNVVEGFVLLLAFSTTTIKDMILDRVRISRIAKKG